MASIAIRSMRPADIPTISEWLVDIPLGKRYGLTVETTRTQFERALDESDLLLVADRHGDDHPCGFAWCLPGGAFGRSYYLRLIGVRPDCAGMGIGSLLLNQAEYHAQDRGSDFFLLVSDFNRDAQRFYQRHGYEQIGAIPGYVLPDVTEFIYWKHLAADNP